MSSALIFVISAPAGTGKTTLVRMLKKEFQSVVSSISYTTRAPRVNEESGKDYYFISEKEFKEKIQEGEFLEYAEVFGSYYGTSKKRIDSLRGEGKHVVLVIDTQGAMQIKKKLEAIFIFISPPSLQELESRLQRRKSETKAAIEGRLAKAKEEISFAPFYDYHIVNDHLKGAYDVLRSILIAEEHRNR